MDSAFRQIQVENRGSVYCVRLKHRRMNDADLVMLGDELAEIIQRERCQALVVGLGFDMLECVYSMFLGTLISTRRQLLDRGGQLHLCEVGPASLGVLKTCKLTELFEIHPDMESAIKALQPRG